MAREPLGGEDAAWLHMEDETNPMVINMVLELAGPLPPDRFAELLARLASRPRFRARMVAPKLHVGFPSWEEAADFDVAHHVEHVRLDAGDGALQTFVGGVVSTLLDTERPLWRIIVIDRPGAGTTLLVRIHHAMADGFALLGVLLSLCDDGVASEITPPIQRPGRAATAIAAAAALQRLVFLPTDPRTSLKGPLGRTKRVAWSRPLPLDAVKRVARAASATVNDVLVATAAGALARHLARQGDGVAALEIHAMVPVNLRTSVTTTTLGNRFGLVILGLPVGVSDPLARVAAVKQRMKLLKGTPEAVVTHALLR
ncbi:MAG TPA: wax ester/triacylglycerol synthase domain-containing protein, partial [Labilithrix sp.]|nr:wax ester/triacylglycerol synthase domain-containing protein [Labilithrix sp.]